jgi:dTDP-4-dehydrorhamnose 3,5-epimerase
VKFIPASIPDVLVIEPAAFLDDRGFLMETYHECKFKAGGILLKFVQENHSRSRQGVLRGMHFQVGQVQGKLVRVVNGEIFDVVVDLRRSSFTYKQWTSVRLSEENHRMLWVPPGFAHGFYVLSPAADVVYMLTDFYTPEAERTLRWDDPEVGIDWPLVADQPLVISAKDASATLFKDIPASDLFD